MKKKNKNEYLPLYWCRNMRKQAKQSVGENVSSDEMFAFANIIRNSCTAADSQKVVKAVHEFGNKYPEFRKVTDSINLLSESNPERAAFIWDETIKDLDSMANIMKWSEMKQVFRFDSDFLDELIKTENLAVSKNAWDYLPFDNFYVDISDNKELCRQLAGEGFFVTVKKESVRNWYDEENIPETLYEIHLCKISRKYFFHDLISVPNGTYDCEPEGAEDTEIKLHDVICDNHANPAYVLVNDIKVNVKTYQVLVVQILNYLASVEPDIDENPETKATYRPKSESADKS